MEWSDVFRIVFDHMKVSGYEHRLKVQYKLSLASREYMVVLKRRDAEYRERLGTECWAWVNGGAGWARDYYAVRGTPMLRHKGAEEARRVVCYKRAHASEIRRWTFCCGMRWEVVWAWYWFSLRYPCDRWAGMEFNVHHERHRQLLRLLSRRLSSGGCGGARVCRCVVPKYLYWWWLGAYESLRARVWGAVKRSARLAEEVDREVGEARGLLGRQHVNGMLWQMIYEVRTVSKPCNQERVRALRSNLREE